ncbi:MAG: TolC family protein [Pseudomonadota bacterium]
MMSRKIILFLTALASPVSHADVAITLDAFIDTILNNNPGVQRILEQEAIAAGQLESSLGIDDPLLSTSGGLSRTEFEKIAGFEADSSNNLEMAVGVDRVFSDTGTRASVSYGNTYTDRSPALPSDLGATFHQPSLTLRLTQPLLDNAGGIQDRLNINLNRLNHAFARLDSREQLESYITQLAALYLDWYQAFREVEILEAAWNKVQEQEKLVRLKVSRQVAEEYELLRIQETLEDYYSRWQQADANYLGLARQIEKQMNRPAEAQQQPATVLVPVDSENASLLQPVTDSKPDYLATDSNLKAILDNLKAQQDELLAARDNSRKADLGLSLEYRRHGANSEFVDAHSGDLDKNDYSVMLEYSYPLGNRSASGAYQTQLASKRQVAADTAQQLLDAEAALADLQAREEKLAEALAAADRKIRLATRKLVKEQELYRIGQLDLFELLQDATTQLESRLSRTRLYVQLQQIRLSIRELLDRNLQPIPSGALTHGSAPG